MSTTIDQTVSELIPLLTQIVSEIKKNNVSISEVSDLFTQFIQEKNKTSMNNPEITTLLTQIVGLDQSNPSDSELSILFDKLIDEKKKIGISNSEITTLLTQIMGITKKSTLTAPEVSTLWTQYMGDSMSICVYKYFLSIIEDKEIRSILEFALQLSENHITKIKLKSENFQVPVGFTENDVNMKAPRLFSDDFLLFYSNVMTIHGLTAYSLAITTSERQDIQNYFYECTVTAKELFQKIVSLGNSRPKFSGAPSIPSPHGVEFIDKTGIITDLFGEKRPLNVSEINNLYFNSKKTGFVRSLSLAFSQVAELEEVRKFMLKNVELAGKDAESLDVLLQQDNLPTPLRWDADITDSTVSPFSDKLMMFHAAFLASAALSYYGAALGSSLRPDIIVNYKQVFNHAMQAGAESYKIMVKHGWLEKQPEAIDRKSLAQCEKK